MGRFSVALKIRGDMDDWGTAQAESQCRPARIEPIRPISVRPRLPRGVGGDGGKEGQRREGHVSWRSWHGHAHFKETSLPVSR